MAYDIVITTYNDIFIILGFLFQHLALGNLQSTFYSFYHLLVLVI